MKQKFRINLLLNKREFDILLKCVEFFKNASNFFDNSEWNVEADELRKRILDHYLIEIG